MKETIEMHLASINEAVQNITPENKDVYTQRLSDLFHYLIDNLDFPEVDGLEIYFSKLVHYRNQYMNKHRVIGWKQDRCYRTWMYKQKYIKSNFYQFS